MNYGYEDTLENHLFDMMDGGWVRDLTQEGIEPNPGWTVNYDGQPACERKTTCMIKTHAHLEARESGKGKGEPFNPARQRITEKKKMHLKNCTKDVKTCDQPHYHPERPEQDKKYACDCFESFDNPQDLSEHMKICYFAPETESNVVGHDPNTVLTQKHEGMPRDGQKHEHKHRCFSCNAIYSDNHIGRTYEEHREYNVAHPKSLLCFVCRDTFADHQKRVITPTQTPAPPPQPVQPYENAVPHPLAPVPPVRMPLKQWATDLDVSFGHQDTRYDENPDEPSGTDLPESTIIIENTHNNQTPDAPTPPDSKPLCDPTSSESDSNLSPQQENKCEGALSRIMFFFTMLTPANFMIIPYTFWRFIRAGPAQEPICELTFEVEDDNPKLPSFYRWMYCSIQIVMPLTTIWLVFDLFIWPVLCFYSLKIMEANMGYFGLILGSVIFFSENLIAVIYCFLVARVHHYLNESFKTKRKHVVTKTNITLDADRPHNVSFGDTYAEMDIAVDSVYQIYSVELSTLGIELDFYSHKINEDNDLVSWGLFSNYIATHSGQGTPKDFRHKTEQHFMKSCYVQWNKDFMVKNSVVRNTLELTVDRHAWMNSEKTSTPLDKYNITLFGNTSFVPWWFKGAYNRTLVIVACIVLSVTFLMILKQMLAGLIVLCYFASDVWTKIIMNEKNFTPFPVGAYGARVYDEFHGRYDGLEFIPMKINDVNENKDLIIYQDIKIPDSRLIDRAPMGAFHPFFIPGIAMPKVDQKCPLTFWAGLLHRGAGKTPDPDPKVLLSKSKYAEEMMQALVPVAFEEDILSVEEALGQTSYSIAQKEQILDWEYNAHHLDDTIVNETTPFGKDEPYEVRGKHERTIQAGSKTMWAKGLFGSLSVYVKTLEHVFYDKITSNIKMISPDEQVAKIIALGAGSKTESDFSSYEASFSRPIQESAQFKAYDHYYGNIGNRDKILATCRRLLGGKTTMKNKFGRGNIRNLKCSGSPDTAFSNWFDNVVTFCHIFYTKHNVHWTVCLDWLLCEGDDNLTDDHGLKFSKKDFAAYGLTAKISDGFDLEDSGFCQRFVNTSTNNMVMDPIRYLGRSQYIPVKYINAKESKKLSMVKAKAMSTLAFCPNGPVVSEHAWAILQNTRNIGVSQKHLDKAARYGQTIKVNTNFSAPKITESDRLMVSERFGFSIKQQEQFTKILKSWAGGPLILPVAWFPEDWSEFYDDYATTSSESTNYQGWGLDNFHNYFTCLVGEYSA